MLNGFCFAPLVLEMCWCSGPRLALLAIQGGSCKACLRSDTARAAHGQAGSRDSGILGLWVRSHSWLPGQASRNPTMAMAVPVRYSWNSRMKWRMQGGRDGNMSNIFVSGKHWPTRASDMLGFALLCRQREAGWKVFCARSAVQAVRSLSGRRFVCPGCSRILRESRNGFFWEVRARHSEALLGNLVIPEEFALPVSRRPPTFQVPQRSRS